MKNSSITEITNRHTDEYLVAIRRDKNVKSSNRDQVLMGEQEEVVNQGANTNAGGKFEALNDPCAGDADHDAQNEGGAIDEKFTEVDENDDHFQRMD